MMKQTFLLFLFICHVSAESATDFLKAYNSEVPNLGYASAHASFKKATNITAYNTKVATEASKNYSKELKQYRERAMKIDLSKESKDTKRQFKFILMTMRSKNESILDEVLQIGNAMSNIYSEGSVPYNAEKITSIPKPKDRNNLRLSSDIVPLMSTSRNPDELLYVWKGWRDAVGPRVKDKYKEYVRLNNIGARENGFTDAGDYKRKIYEVNDLKESAENFWKELEPFYEEVHAYVRYKLAQKYPKHVNKTEPIPAHLFGNMWAQSWENIMDIVEPYKKEPLDITDTLKKNYTVVDMFKMAEEFFVSIGWEKLPGHFWNKSMLVQPPDRNVTCHASAWDFSVVKDGDKDVRVKMCTNIDQSDFITIHHELGHIYYYLKYWNQPYEYRTGANPGFHEAVGDTMSLSVQTPQHLYKIGLLKNISESKEADINFLLKTALEKIAFLPFGYLMDQWMWGVYSGDIKPEEYNKKWWEMRLKYQGIKPPVPRTENDFDPGAKYHIPADTPYIRYFFAHILQFTFHKYACKAAKHTGDLHKCSIYQSKEAGKLFGDMLSLGKEKKWPEALKMVTGSSTLSAEPIKEYFAPLSKWLKEYRATNDYPVGWKEKEAPSSAVNNKANISVIVSIVTLFTLLHSLV